MFRTWWRQLAKRKCQATWGGRRTAVRSRRSGPLRLERLEDRLVPTLYTWTGHAALDGYAPWSNPGNWFENRAPGGDSSADLVFPSRADIYRTINDYGHMSPRPIRIEGDGYQLFGQRNYLDNNGYITSTAGQNYLGDLQISDSPYGDNHTFYVGYGSTLVAAGSIIPGTEYLRSAGSARS